MLKPFFPKLGILLLVTAWASPATASSSAYCAEELDTVCANLNGEVAQTECLKDHQDDLTQGCKATVFSDLRAQVKEACVDDVENFCHGIPHGRSLVIACLKKNFEQLSPVCQSAVDRARQ